MNSQIVLDIRDKIYYKVLCIRAGKLESFLWRAQEYIVGEFVQRKPHYGPFAVFSSLERAQKFIVDNVIGENSVKFHPIYSCHIVESKERALYWDNGMILHGEDIPEGTVFADQVKLLEKIL